MRAKAVVVRVRAPREARKRAKEKRKAKERRTYSLN